jgi:cell division transport system permease protein
MRALKYFITEAGASLWRRRGAAALAILTIAAGLFVLGFFLALNVNLAQVIGRWSESAELSVYLEDEASPEQIAEVERVLDESGLVAERVSLSKEQAAARFKEDFPDMADAASQLESNPFPASIEATLRPQMRDAGDALEAVAREVSALGGVADVRYDRRWIGRLNAVVTFVRGLGLLIAAMLVVASALTVANVVRLAAAARRDEIQIMQLVGAPLAYVRGPFIVEGMLQGGLGALVALLALRAGLAALNARYGSLALDVLGTGAVSFLPPVLWVGIIGGGMLLGFVGGTIVARGVR